jgi:hypothetical protein
VPSPVTFSVNICSMSEQGVRSQKLKIGTLLIIIFYSRGTVYKEFVPRAINGKCFV